MDHFHYRKGQLYAEAVPLAEIAARFGTPVYVYSRATLERHWHAFDHVLRPIPHLVCFAVKANSNLAVLNLLARLGSGFDVVSVGELERVIAAGGDPARTLFSGVGKRRDEILRALELGIRTINVESRPELERVAELARESGHQAPIALRVNPDVDAGTHPYIATGLRDNKFGIDPDEALDLYRWAAGQPQLRLEGIDCHIGSQLTSVEPFLAALDRVLHLVDRLADQGIRLHHLDLGGGLGIRYQDELPPEPADYARPLMERLRDRDLELILEPGRAIAGNAGILLTRVEYLKSTPARHFAIVDAAMNDLLRPALYGAWQEIVPVVPRAGEPVRHYDIVGPVCETGDFLGKDRVLNIEAGDLLAVRSAGAYGFTMSSNYNSRPRPPEVLVDGDQAHLVRHRETLSGLFAAEIRLPES